MRSIAEVWRPFLLVVQDDERETVKGLSDDGHSYAAAPWCEEYSEARPSESGFCGTGDRHPVTGTHLFIVLFHHGDGNLLFFPVGWGL